MTHCSPPLRLILTAAFAVTLSPGCFQREVYWTVAKVDADQGRDTLIDEKGMQYHNDYMAIVLQRNDETLNIIYENRIPDHVRIAVGDRLAISVDHEAIYSEVWQGYWLHDVTLNQIPNTE
ncbi:hypothetical protein CA13_11370 [Planctomycetes bacterium CA13]|uniref:Uncharacterized protein n=1 Tax=Novipirellula herctigrandis TaxID=2527986 RepID=A0A5C5YXW0_9BACT|nr:hypothetical protein CA13_11370 [Planctomycetes bacterium CA13]